MPILLCFMNTTFNTTINLFIFILFLLRSVSNKKMLLRILKHYVIISMFNTAVCMIAHHRGKFLLILKTKIQLKQSNRYYYYCIIISIRNVYIVRLVRIRLCQYRSVESNLFLWALLRY